MAKSLALFAVLAVMLCSNMAVQAGEAPTATHASLSSGAPGASFFPLLPELITSAAAAQEEAPAEEQAQNEPPQKHSKADVVISTIVIIFPIIVGLVLGTVGPYAYRRYRIFRAEGRYQAKSLAAMTKEIKRVELDKTERVLKSKLIPVQSKPFVVGADDANSKLTHRQSAREDQAGFVVNEIDLVVEEAKFFMALGRASLAIDLLADHIEANVDNSAQPWVYLMGIYRSLGEKEAFVELAANFRARFNVVEPQWDQDDAELLRPDSLDEFPRIESKLIAMWGTPDCVRFLIELICNNRDGTRVGFNMEIFDEILLLLAIAEMRNDMTG